MKETGRQFGRVITAMVTPFDADGNFSAIRARKLAWHLADTGSTGIVVAGTTGESPTLNGVERSQVLGVVLDEVGDRISVIAGTSTYDTRESVQNSKRAQRQGARGLLLVTPYYNKPPQEGLRRHFSEIASAVDIPVIVYNVPSRTNVNLEPETVLKLDEEFENVVGLKEAVGLSDPAGKGKAQVKEVIDGKSKEFEVWSGNDEDTLEMLRMGGYGVVSVASHVVGNKIDEMIERETVLGQPDTADALNAKLMPLFKALFPPKAPVSSPASIKALLNSIGIKVGEVRLPLVSVPASYAAELTEIYNLARIS